VIRSYLPHTPEDRRDMLAVIGAKSVEELFCDIPAAVRLKRSLNLPAALSEPELVRHLEKMAGQNSPVSEMICFRGAGAYDHYIPSVVDPIISRSEFYTAYTQYQPEIAQGYLQALWEYQSLIAILTGMEMATSSLYDGGTALAEAAMMACNVAERKEVVVSLAIHPHYREVLATYGRDWGFQIVEVAATNGLTEIEQLKKIISPATAAVLIQTPNFFGSIEDLQELADVVHNVGALLVTSVNPISLGILEPPGAFGVDIVVGEGQPLGIPLSFGGPYLGFFATSEKLMRKTPGRIVGQTSDYEGTRGYVLTLQAREQHIRREKATSNICSNEALCSLAAAVYLCALGKKGLQDTASQCTQKAHYAFRKITAIKKFSPVFTSPFFHEFVVRCPIPVSEVNVRLAEKGMIGGLDLGRYYSELVGCMLICVTEKRTREEIDTLIAGLEAM